MTFSPASVTPSLTGTVDVEIDFEDAGAIWYDVWAEQSAGGEAFSVTNAAESTTIRLGTNNLTLDPVPLENCESRTARAVIHAPFGTELNLDMQVTLTDQAGNVVATSSGECFQPEDHSIFGQADAGTTHDAGPVQ
jgi:hypothetical protein